MRLFSGLAVLLLLANAQVANAATTVRLPAAMCPAHRQDVLGEVRERLAAGLPVLLVSTQLVEAGVDVDFPVVYRAVAPADSLWQAAGRANREGRLGDGGGRVVVFDPADGGMPGSYRTQVGTALRHFGPGKPDPDDLATLGRYYQDLYRSVGVERRTGRGATIQRPLHESTLSAESVELGTYKHYMQKEIFEQPRAIGDTLELATRTKSLPAELFGADAPKILSEIDSVLILACGTSSHAGLVAKRSWP